MVKVGIGQDSHRFDSKKRKKKLVLAGVIFDGELPLEGNSDADVIFHSITNAISSITGTNVIGETSDEMCRRGITDSKEYLRVALSHLTGYKVLHVSTALEGRRPKIAGRINEMKESIARIIGISSCDVGITATSGEGLTSFGKGDGIQAVSIVTVERVSK